MMKHEIKLHIMLAITAVCGIIAGIVSGLDYGLTTVFAILAIAVLCGVSCLAQILDRLDAGIRSELHIMGKRIDEDKDAKESEDEEL